MNQKYNRSRVVAGYGIPKNNIIKKAVDTIQDVIETFDKSKKYVYPAQRVTKIKHQNQIKHNNISKVIHVHNNQQPIVVKVKPQQFVHPKEQSAQSEHPKVIKVKPQQFVHPKEQSEQPNLAKVRPQQFVHPKEQPKPLVEQSEQPKKFPMIRTKFNVENDYINITGASVRGSSHITSNDPCQDFSLSKIIDDKWSISVVSDGAGSCKSSQKGSKNNCIKAITYFENEIIKANWIKNNITPSQLDWYIMCVNVYNKIYADCAKHAKAQNFKVTELSATIIVNIKTPFGLLVSHIGDGRAGYLNSNNEWKPSITPHKGEESNQTVFLHSNMHSVIGFRMSNTLVPECNVIVDDVKAFTLMSDGCEKATWYCSTFENEVFNDPNTPFEKFFNNIISHMKDSDTKDADLADILIDGTTAFSKESDDKTIIIAYCK